MQRKQKMNLTASNQSYPAIAFNALINLQKSGVKVNLAKVKDNNPIPFCHNGIFKIEKAYTHPFCTTKGNFCSVDITISFTERKITLTPSFRTKEFMSILEFWVDKEFEFKFENVKTDKDLTEYIKKAIENFVKKSTEAKHFE